MRSISTPRVLLETIEAQTAKTKASRPSQISALRKLFELFTTERRQLNRFHYLDDPPLRHAYLQYNLPLNVARSMVALRDVVDRHPDVADLEDVFDLGAGPGSSTLATLFTLAPRAARRYVLTDRSAKGMKLAREVYEACDTSLTKTNGTESSKASFLTQKLPSLPNFTRPSLVWMSMVLNELSQADGRGLDLARLFDTLTRRLPVGSVLLVVEPALRVPGRRLLELHDGMVESPEWELLAPCTHQAACPLLRAQKRPWCHFHFAWEPGKSIEKLARAVGHDKPEAALSYLAIRRIDSSAESTEPSKDDKSLARVIGDRMPVRGGKSGQYVCRDGKRHIETALPTAIERGDVVRVLLRKPAEIVRRWP